MTLRIESKPCQVFDVMLFSWHRSGGQLKAWYWGLLNQHARDHGCAIIRETETLPRAEVRSEGINSL